MGSSAACSRAAPFRRSTHGSISRIVDLIDHHGLAHRGIVIATTGSIDRTVRPADTANRRGITL
jgi:hypothetical protein